MDCYNELAQYYDMLMEDVDYEKWADYVEKLFVNEGFKPETILDAACGTGNITIPLAKKGYKLVGADISEDMLAVAENKARCEKLSISFFRQNMTNINIPSNFDCILCMCDGVNYLLEEEEVVAFFTSAYNKLKEKGILIFDISSYNKLQCVLGNNLIYEEKNEIHYIWENFFDEEKETVEMQLTFFIPEKDLYRKFTEHHVQKAYKNDYLVQQLQRIGFKNIKFYGEFEFKEPGEDSERIFFTAAKG